MSVGSYWSDYSTSYRVSGSLLRVCWPAWLSHFLSFPFSSPLSLRGRGAPDNTRTTLVSHSTLCQLTLTDARARTFYNLVTNSAIMARSEDERYLTLEDQLAQLRQQVVEERESRAAAEKAAADRAAKQRSNTTM